MIFADNGRQFREQDSLGNNLLPRNEYEYGPDRQRRAPSKPNRLAPEIMASRVKGTGHLRKAVEQEVT